MIEKVDLDKYRRKTEILELLALFEYLNISETELIFEQTRRRTSKNLIALVKITLTRTYSACKHILHRVAPLEFPSNDLKN